MRREAAHHACRSATLQGRLVSSAAAVLVLLPAAASARADEPRATRSAITPQVSLVAAKRLDVAREFIELGEWDAAILALDDLSDDFGDALVETEPGRFVNVARAAQATIAQMPAAGLAAYRDHVDATARFQYEEAAQRDDARAMEELLRTAFASSVGDEALRWLAEHAWSRGELDHARKYWTHLLPLTASPGQEQPLVLRYPDSDFRPAEVRARLILCTVMQGDLAEAERDLEVFRGLHPGIEGRLAGRSGLLADVLASVLDEARQWPPRDAGRACPTFACGPSRAHTSRLDGLLWQPQWSTALQAMTLPTPSETGWPSLLSQLSAASFPVVWNDIVLINDTRTVRALRLSDGAPAWPTGRAEDRGELYRAPVGDSMRLPSVGVVRHTATIHEGRYYARMGPPLLVPASRSLRRLEDRLICLDLAGGEGRLEWEVTAADLTAQDGWRFSGSPLAVDGRLYVAMRRAGVQVELAVAALDAATGRLLWHQPAAVDLEAPPAAYHRVGHELLTYGAGSLYYATGAGAVAALDAATGTLEWVSTYPSRPPTLWELHDPAKAGLLPPVFHHANVYAASPDASWLLCIDAASGLEKWRRTRPDELNALLGVQQGLLVAAGDQLWGMDAETGRIEWRFGSDDPAAAGFGRGAIAGPHVLWTTREDLYVIDVATGRAVRRMPLSAYGLFGGNLIVADDHVLLAAPDRLTVFAAP